MEVATCINLISISSLLENRMKYNGHDGSPLTNTGGKDAGNFVKLYQINIML
jgi:hypothetical protein